VRGRGDFRGGFRGGPRGGGGGGGGSLRGGYRTNDAATDTVHKNNNSVKSRIPLVEDETGQAIPFSKAACETILNQLVLGRKELNDLKMRSKNLETVFKNVEHWFEFFTKAEQPSAQNTAKEPSFQTSRQAWSNVDPTLPGTSSSSSSSSVTNTTTTVSPPLPIQNNNNNNTKPMNGLQQQQMPNHVAAKQTITSTTTPQPAKQSGTAPTPIPTLNAVAVTPAMATTTTSQSKHDLPLAGVSTAAKSVRWCDRIDEEDDEDEEDEDGDDTPLPRDFDRMLRISRKKLTPRHLVFENGTLQTLAVRVLYCFGMTQPLSSSSSCFSSQNALAKREVDAFESLKKSMCLYLTFVLRWVFEQNKFVPSTSAATANQSHVLVNTGLFLPSTKTTGVQFLFLRAKTPTDDNFFQNYEMDCQSDDLIEYTTSISQTTIVDRIHPTIPKFADPRAFIVRDFNLCASGGHTSSNVKTTMDAVHASIRQLVESGKDEKEWVSWMVTNRTRVLIKPQQNHVSNAKKSQKNAADQPSFATVHHEQDAWIVLPITLSEDRNRVVKTHWCVFSLSFNQRGCRVLEFRAKISESATVKPENEYGHADYHPQDANNQIPLIGLEDAYSRMRPYGRLNIPPAFRTLLDRANAFGKRLY